MPLHLVKLCVGCRDIAHLAAFQKARREATGRNAHITRMVPRRAKEILDGGSLYWVINGMITVRQRIVAIEPFVDDEGVKRSVPGLALSGGGGRAAGHEHGGWRESISGRKCRFFLFERSCNRCVQGVTYPCVNLWAYLPFACGFSNIC